MLRLRHEGFVIGLPLRQRVLPHPMRDFGAGPYTNHRAQGEPCIENDMFDLRAVRRAVYPHPADAAEWHHK
eukprot:9739193-Lingulodinium_polyedra.AAC.1